MIETRAVNHEYLGYSCRDTDDNNDFPQAPSSSYRINCLSITLGKGLKLYKMASTILQEFKMTHALGWIEVHIPSHTTSTSSKPIPINHSSLCTLANVFGIAWVLNPCRIISARFDTTTNTSTSTTTTTTAHTTSTTTSHIKSKHTATESTPKQRLISQISFTTVKGHLLTGEERFRIIYDINNDNVIFDMYSFSKPSNVLGWIALPYVRYVQGTFFREQAGAMRRLIEREEEGL